MSQHIDLLSIPTLWTALPTHLSNGLRLNVYVDPTKRFFSISPVTTVERLEDWLNMQTDAPARPRSVKEAMRLRDAAWAGSGVEDKMNETGGRPSIIAMIDELLTDAGTEERRGTEEAQGTQSQETTSTPVARRITPREFEKTVYARMQGRLRKQEEHFQASVQRAEERLKREATGHPIISPDAKVLKRPPLYQRTIELEKEHRSQRERMHNEKILQEKDEEEKLIQKQKEADMKIRATCKRGPKEFFEFNQKKVQEREKHLEERRVEKAALEVAGLDFKPAISQKSRRLAQHRGSFLQRVKEETERRANKLHSLKQKYTPSFHPEIMQSRVVSMVEDEEVFDRLYEKRRHSESPQRVRASDDFASPSRTNRTAIIPDPISEEP